MLKPRECLSWAVPVPALRVVSSTLLVLGRYTCVNRRRVSHVHMSGFDDKFPQSSTSRSFARRCAAENVQCCLPRSSLRGKWKICCRRRVERVHVTRPFLHHVHLSTAALSSTRPTLSLSLSYSPTPFPSSPCPSLLAANLPSSPTWPCVPIRSHGTNRQPTAAPAGDGLPVHGHRRKHVHLRS